MTPQELLEAFDAVADAEGGVDRLRELILSLAIRGRLVPQDPEDEPARVFLDRLQEEGTPKRKVGRAHGRGARVGASGGRFEIPGAWAWVSLPDIASYSIGRTPPTKDSRFWSDDGIPWVTIGDMPDGGIVTRTGRRVTEESVKEIFRGAPDPPGTLLMSFKLTIGKVAVLGCQAFHNEAIISVVPLSEMNQRYLMLMLPVLAAAGRSKAAIKGATLNSDSLGDLPIPVPPILEQGRIVARVDELLALCDRLEECQRAERAVQALFAAAVVRSFN